MTRRFTTLDGKQLPLRHRIGWQGELMTDWGSARHPWLASVTYVLDDYAQQTACALLGHSWTECGNAHQPQHIVCVWCDKRGGTR